MRAGVRLCRLKEIMKVSKPLFVLAAVSAVQTVVADEINTNPVVVSSSRYPVNEYNASFATEIYTSQDIEASGATSLYDFLDTDSSVNVLPGYGNPLSQLIDMRGYGISSGFENIAVTVDGRRLNNIDNVPQLLSSIPLANIERIEITKGSGSVQYGDGAMAGAIHIITKEATGVAVGASVGSYGLLGSKLSAGAQTDTFSVNAVSETYHTDGYSQPDINGQLASSDSNNLNASAKYYATDKLELRLSGTQTQLETAYPGPLSYAQFQSDPSQNGGNYYPVQTYQDNNSSGGFTYDISPTLKLSYDRNLETKTSTYTDPYYNATANYDYLSHDTSLQYHHNGTRLILGQQTFDGTRTSSSNDTSKSNDAIYLQSVYTLDSSSINAGIRSEQVSYLYSPNSGSKLSATHSLLAYELGYNQKVDANRSWFANYNHAFQAPNIDRFFTYMGAFNDFIAPAISDTLNLGLSAFHESYNWKLSAFYASLRNEIYLYVPTYTNTNIDKSHKYGLEAQYKVAITDNFSTKLNYTYTRAIIDSENDGGGAFNGKTLPGVPEHNLNLSLKYGFSKRSSLSFEQTYRSEAYAADDFANSLSQKQAAYNMSNLGYRYTIGNTMLYARIENLFENKNGMWIHDDAIYPVNFKRSWQLGFTSKF